MSDQEMTEEIVAPHRESFDSILSRLHEIIDLYREQVGDKNADALYIPVASVIGMYTYTIASKSPEEIRRRLILLKELIDSFNDEIDPITPDNGEND